MVIRRAMAESRDALYNSVLACIYCIHLLHWLQSVTNIWGKGPQSAIFTVWQNISGFEPMSNKKNLRCVIMGRVVLEVKICVDLDLCFGWSIFDLRQLFQKYLV